MTEEQRDKCNAMIQELAAAGIAISLHEFRVTSGYRVVGMDGDTRRFLRDGGDPLALLSMMKQLFGIKEAPNVVEEHQQPLA